MLPASREHKIFLFIVLSISVAIFVVGIVNIDGFFDHKPKQECRNLVGIPYDATFSCPNPVPQVCTSVVLMF